MAGALSRLCSAPAVLSCRQFASYLRPALGISLANGGSVGTSRRLLSTSSDEHRYDLSKPIVWDVCVIGAGIVGLATARQVARSYPNYRIAVLEAEKAIAGHQTGHNSGVIHAGIYYEPGSRMAQCCVEGARKIYDYCAENDISFERSGKLIVATEEKEIPALHELFERGKKNGVEGLEILNGLRTKELEPNIRAVGSLHSPNTGITDFAEVARNFGKDLCSTGRGHVFFNFAVDNIQVQKTTRTVLLEGREKGQNGPTKRLEAKHVIACAGLQSDRIGVLAGFGPSPRVVPFRGGYLQLKAQYRNIVKRNIYPVPNSSGIPVGLHLSPAINHDRGRQLIVGPGCCIAFSRDGYKMTDFSLRDLIHSTASLGFWKFAAMNMSLSFSELYRDFNRNVFVKDAQKLCPSITREMLEESFTGVMSQVFQSNGKPASDFIFQAKSPLLLVRSAPSPACTGSMAIAEFVAQKAAEEFSWTQ